MSEIKTYIEDNSEWKECVFLTGEELAKQATELLRENKKLNNIINEIEDSIIREINVLYQVKNQVNAIQELRFLLNKIKEFKGDDKG